jgi:hypothetical protein
MPGALCLTLLLAQSLPTEAGEAAQLERIRRQLARPPALLVLASWERNGLVFRVTVRGRKPDRPVWEDLSGVPADVRPMAPTYHYEFLDQVTPEAFRQGTLYPVGVPIVPMIELLGKQIRTAKKRTAEARAREEVRQALEELLACRANPDKPGC